MKTSCYKSILYIFILASLMAAMVGMLPTEAAQAAQDGTISPAPLSATYDCSGVTEIHQVECAALVALYNSTNGAGWTTNTNWLVTNTPCSWYGVGCGGGRVASINLDANHLTGSLPPELGNLTFLSSLSFSQNELSGSIPVELGNLILLQNLSLWENQLTGSIPAELGNLTQLEYVPLCGNQLTGNIPTELGNLTHLTGLCLSDNLLSGSIPAQLGNLTQLTTFRLENNQLSGSIPTELGNLTLLQKLTLENNLLTGSIPVELGNLTQLKELRLRENQLSGSIPAQLGNLTQLTSLELDINQLNGSIPPELGNLTQLTFLSLAGNQLTGNIPAELGNLTQLTWLGLCNNQLTGNIPAELGNLTHLTTLWLDTNQLTGSIPVELGNLTQLTGLYLHSNQLSGEFPASITNLVNLTTLTFDCGLTSSNPAVIAFVSQLDPDWHIRCPVTFWSTGIYDGWALESTETGNAGSSLNTTATTFRLGDDAAKKQYRSILSFNTGTSLPDDTMITKVTLKIKKQGIVGGGNPLKTFQGFMADIKNGVFGKAALQPSDFQAKASKTYGPFKPALVGGWYSLDLTNGKGYINKLSALSGLTQIRLRFKLDDNNNAVANYLSLFSGNAPATSRPQLIIEYTVP
jgi:Leucine-rich repeat (LRR) protein